MELLLAKVVVSVAAVMVLSVIAERVSTRIAGVLSGFPLGTAITIYFIGLDQGPDFVAEGAFHTGLGFVASLMLVISWYQVSQKIKRSSVAIAAVISTLVFLLSAMVLKFVSANFVTALLLPFLAIYLAIQFLTPIKNIKIEGRARSSWKLLLLRAVLATLIVLVITGVAESVGPTWSGLFSAFPVTVFPLLLIIHLSYGPLHVQTLIKNFPFGLGSLVLYAYSIHWSYPALGIEFGTIVSLLVAVLYMLVLYLWTTKASSQTVEG
ncbi:hypothetical protein [Endozoicomonas arenosclerae]|uniref:hypothetical protein n=1 Tax=Endozoicomonas arenosclerae TaxID=1633495 RepID=UPI000A44F826|nr:hypothetical protein [Endozoicomonas arenosclerae]